MILQVLFLIYSIGVAIVFMTTVMLDRSEDGSVTFTEFYVPEKSRMIVFALVALFWPILLFSITRISYRGKDLFKRNKDGR